MGNIPYTTVTDWNRPWALLSTGASPGDAEREAARALRRSQEITKLRRPTYVIRKDKDHPAALRAYDARTGMGISPGFFNATITQVRAWVKKNEPTYGEVD